MILSKNFTLEELIKSPIALRKGIDNSPNREARCNLATLVEKILQPVRDHYNAPVNVSSGYRCLELNRVIGSKDTSQHIKGEAADFEVGGAPNITVARWIRDNLDFDQLILEFYNPGVLNSGWVHCSYSAGKNRKEVLTIANGRTLRGLVG